MTDHTVVERRMVRNWWRVGGGGALVLLQPDQEHLGQHLVHQVLQQGWDPDHEDEYEEPDHLADLPPAPHAPVVQVERDHGQPGGEGHQGDGHSVIKTCHIL